MSEAVYADAVIEERQLIKALSWYDGFVIALANPGFLLGSLGYSIGALGGWGAIDGHQAGWDDNPARDPLRRLVSLAIFGTSDHWSRPNQRCG